MAAAPHRPPTVVYIASLGHSGSTLLDLLIASHDQAIGLGEVKNLSSRPRRRHRKRRLDEIACDCGVSPRRACPLWSALEEGLRRRSGLGLDDLELEDGPDALFHAHNRAFYEAVVEASGAKVVVDSSKSLQRLARLLATPGLELRPIHLTRDPRGVAASHARRGRAWPATLRRWLAYERALPRVLASREILSVHYESLAEQPERVLAQVMEWLGLALQPGQLDWTRHVHHHLAGNPIRRERSAEIRLDDAWRRELGPLARALIPLAARLAGGAPPRGRARSPRAGA